MAATDSSGTRPSSGLLNQTVDAVLKLRNATGNLAGQLWDKYCDGNLPEGERRSALADYVKTPESRMLARIDQAIKCDNTFLGTDWSDVAGQASRRRWLLNTKSTLPSGQTLQFHMEWKRLDKLYPVDPNTGDQVGPNQVCDWCGMFHDNIKVVTKIERQ